MNLGTEPPGLAPFGDVLTNVTSRSGSGNGSGLSSTLFTTEKMAVLAPMPSVNAASAAAVKPGVCRNIRSECLRSRKKSGMAPY